MTATELITNLLAGGLLGLLGQGIRMAIGLKKHADSAMASPQKDEGINLPRLAISLFIGFVAGALFVLVNDTNYDDRKFIFTVIAAGYAGADFIEGLFNTAINKIKPTEAMVTPEAAKVSKTEEPKVVITNTSDAANPLIIEEETENPKTVG